MSAERKPPVSPARIAESRRQQALRDAGETPELLAAGHVKTVVDRIRTRFPKVIDRLSK